MFFQYSLFLLCFFLFSCSQKSEKQDYTRSYSPVLKENINLSLCAIDEVLYVVVTISGQTNEGTLLLNDFKDHTKYSASERNTGKEIAIIMNYLGGPSDNRPKANKLIFPSGEYLNVLFPLPPFDFDYSELNIKELHKKYIIQHNDYGEITLF